MSHWDISSKYCSLHLKICVHLDVYLPILRRRIAGKDPRIEIGNDTGIREFLKRQYPPHRLLSLNNCRCSAVLS